MSESDDLYAGAVVGRDQPDPSDTLTGDNTEDPLDAGYSPPDREPKAWLGDTTAETRAGESLDQKLAEEEPEVDQDDLAAADAEPRAGRLVQSEDGIDGVGEDVGRDGYAASAEEAAVHIQAEESSP